ncbi:MAG: hypothetical protein SPE90_02400 [Prevotella sp.]|nr:hypothetical protein [Prevotella sp.]MDD6842341.1 hypothetical protein [Prevotellaceae bacterium]MCI7045591.1 hypothetical protein [Prevotella sp.]MDD6976705.1 hypothetical protein [Prevotellaceae bacterium]MDY5005320.1 hypothetical protein [Prevotella sp.]
MEKNTGWGMQTYTYSGSGNAIQLDFIKKKWGEDYYITSVAHGKLGWFVSMTQGTPYTDQSYYDSANWPDTFVREQKEKGNYITSLAASDSRWFVVTSVNSPYYAQEICSAPWDNLSEWIKQHWAQDYYITSIACQNGLWTVVMSKSNIYNDQQYMWAKDLDTLKSKIQTSWDKGFVITALEYGGGEYFCIMSKRNTVHGLQHWNINPSNTGSAIKQYWDQSYRIIYIGG